MGSAVTCVYCGSRRRDAPSTPVRSDNEEEDMWRARFLMEVGKDINSVTRDFPRIPVYVRTATRNNYYKSQEEEERQQQAGREEKGQQRQATHVEMTGCSGEGTHDCLALRGNRVRTAVELLLELCGEDATALLSAWQTEERRLGSADASSLLLAVLLKSGMLRVRSAAERGHLGESGASGTSLTTPEKEAGAAVSTAPAPNGTMNYGAADATVVTLPQYTVRSKALRVMQYMVQSAVFFSIRWLIGVFRFPWCRHMQDVVWTVHVYSEKDAMGVGSGGGGVELIMVQHKQTVRHYVDPQELRNKPRFEVDWTCTICIDPRHLLRDASSPPAMGKDAEVRHITTEVLAARVETPPKTACWVSKIWRGRRDALKARLWNRFQVKLDTVPALHARTTH